jgi:hypothetical protein
MDYFKAGVDYLRKNRGRSSLILALDILFYIFSFLIFNLSLNLILNQFYKLPVEALSGMLKSLETTKTLEEILVSIFLGIFLALILFFILLLLNFAIMKAIIWLLTLKKKITPKILLKSTFLNLILGIIFSIPLILSFSPFLNISETYSETGVLQFSIVDFLPFIIALFITIYFITLFYYLLAKHSALKKSFSSFKLGIMNIKKLILPFVFLFVINLAIMGILRNLGLLEYWPGLIIAAIFLAIISFFNRIYISKTV